MLVNLILNYFGCISQKDCWIWITCAHFGLESQNRREKLRMNTARFGHLNSGTNISCHSEVWILVNTLRYKAWNNLIAKNVRERCRKWGSCLNSRITHSTNAVWLRYTKNTLELIVGDILLELDNIFIHIAYVFHITENKSSINVEPTSYDIFGIFNSPFLIGINVCFSLEEVLLIVC